jgi:hypothetical protein
MTVSTPAFTVVPSQVRAMNEPPGPPPPLPPNWVLLMNQKTLAAPTATFPDGVAWSKLRCPFPKLPKKAGASGLQTTWIGTVTLTPIRVLGPGNVTDKPEPVIVVGPTAADAEVAKSGMARSGSATASLAYFFHGVISISLV